MDSNIDSGLRKEEYTFFGTPEEFEKVVRGFRSVIGGVSKPHLGEVHFVLEDKPIGHPPPNEPGGMLWLIAPHYNANASLRYRLARDGKTILAFHDHKAYPEYYPLKQEFLDFLGRDGWLADIASATGIDTAAAPAAHSENTLIKAALIYYAVTKLGLLQQVACRKVELSEGSYRSVKKSYPEMQDVIRISEKLADLSIADHWKEKYGDEKHSKAQ